ncbi:coiled-coil domain-containing protein 141-like [Plectropomus leopardus]|uniref:coiled-coil domain-containing protein 141-like n=1 Tax=Plectropomus leopardus TaxID=160734 RepID=UPI001C4CBF0B|nr:coiled-coil domain-containing protein 141-like [Plectropomus leopardus]
MEKLKKHEGQVLSAVKRSQQERRRSSRRDEGRRRRRSRDQEEEEEDVHVAMEASLKEGWALLLRLLLSRQQVLLLAADFHRRALEFAVCMDRVEDLLIRADVRLTEVQLSYDSMRKDVLGKSLQVLSSSSILLHKLRRLQRNEALHRTGGVLQEEEEEEEEEEEFPEFPVQQGVGAEGGGAGGGAAGSQEEGGAGGQAAAPTD